MKEHTKLARSTRHLRRKIRRAMPVVLKIPEFRHLWVGQAVSQFGDAMYYMVFLFMIDNITKSSGHTGAAGALMQLPYLLLGFHAGMAADRLDRRKVMLFSDVMSIGLLVTLLVVVSINPSPPGWFLLATGFLLSCVAAFFDPAQRSALPTLVPADQLVEANSLSTSTRTMMQLIGPLGTVILLPLLERAGPRLFFPLAILINLLTFAYSAYRIRQLPAIRVENQPQEARVSVFKEFTEGIKFVWAVPMLRTGIVLTSFLNLVIAPILLGYIEANKEWFGGSATSFAGMQAAFFIGMVVSSLLVMKLNIVHPGRSYSAGLLGVGLAVALLAVAKSFWLFFLLSFLCGIAMPFTVIPLTTYLQVVVPDALRGRVNSSLNMITNTLLPVGWLSAGFIIQSFGIQILFIAVGGGICLVSIAGFLNRSFQTAKMPEGAQSSPQHLIH